MLFVLFGAFMERSGTGQLFMDFALSLTGHTAGGPGKVAVVSSTLFGTVSGSAVANVMVDGPITIPLMKRTGFRPPFAAAIEAVASTGGQIMPPVMGAAAFVMAEFLAVSYLQVTIWALIPAILYYVAVFFAVHFEAKRSGLLGIPQGRPAATRRRDARARAPVHSRSSSCSAACCSATRRRCARWPARCRACRWRCCAPRRARASRWRTVVGALEDGARNTLAVAMACACAGIVIACVTITGLGIMFTQVVVALAQDSLLLALILTALAGIVLGMGMPTTPAYIVMVVAAGAGDHQARRDRSGRAHVRVLFRDPVGDHAAGRAGRLRRRGPRQVRPVGNRVRRDARWPRRPTSFRSCSCTSPR